MVLDNDKPVRKKVITWEDLKKVKNDTPYLFRL